MLDPLRRLGREGFQVTILPVDRYGRVTVEQVAAALTDQDDSGQRDGRQ